MLLEEVSRKRRNEPDLKLFSVIAILIFLGMDIIYSSAFYTKNISFSLQAAITLTLGTIALFMGMAIDTKHWRKIAPYLMIFTLVLLLFVLKWGVKINNAKRWIKVGRFTIQVSEIAKVAIILYLAHLLDNTEELRNFKEFIKTSLPVIITGALIAVEPSISAASIVIFVGFSMIFYAGARLRHLFLVTLFALLLIGSMILAFPHARERILKKTTGGEMYQVKQAKLAIANGGLVGRGPGRGLAKYKYLPEISNDFIFALVAEEFGFIGGISIILLFIFITLRGFYIAREHVHDTYKTTLAMGITVLFSLQAGLHIGINTGLLPPTGVVLPFVSYGKMAILTSMFLAGILLRLYYEIEVKE